MRMENTQKIRDRLQKEKDRLLLRTEKIKERGLGQRQSDVIGELSMYDNHPADVGSETFERGKDIGLWDNAQRLLAQVDHALERLEEGFYGTCERCKEEIESARLDVAPWATLCRFCQEQEEIQKHRGTERPLEEEVLAYPFGRTFLDNTDYTGFDGEDAWQAVERYGTAAGPQDVGGVDSYSDTYIDSSEQRGAVEDVEEVVMEDIAEPFGRAKPRPGKKSRRN
ncbi:MAG TPA: conjugal transfer protein TraR [Firmicutes bacterium]|nr:conjugal transfer protein TraR [Bacillota bacterium]